MVGIYILCLSLIFLNPACQAAGYYKTDYYKHSNANISSQNLALSSSQPFIGPEEESVSHQRTERQAIEIGDTERRLKETFVASFQSDGYYTSQSYGKLKLPLKQDLWNFTLCFRLMTFHDRPKTYVISYATRNKGDEKDNEMVVSMNPNKQNIKFSKMDGRLKLRTYYKSAYRRWRHICIVYNYGKEIEIYIDGEIAGNAILNPLQETRPIRGEGVLILGQEQDDVGSAKLFDASQSFSGSITQVNIWSTLLDNTTIKMYSNCLLSGPKNQLGDVVPWLEEEWEFFNATIQQLPRLDLCKETVGLEDIVFFQQRSYNFYFETCQAIGGELPVFYSQGEFQEFYLYAKKIYGMTSKTGMSVKELGCYFRGDEARFWVGRQRNKETNIWMDPYKQAELPYEGAWYGGEPSEPSHDCANVWTTYSTQGEIKSWYSANCADRSSCAMCETKPGQQIHLKGLCRDEIDSKIFDTDYYIYGMINFRIHLLGVQSSHIFLDDEGQWRLENYMDKSKYAFISKKESNDRYPVGRKTWIVKKGICDLEDKPIEFTLSACNSSMFTCDYGECIDLSKKCDLSPDCKDRSDEEYCNNIELPQGYRETLAPRKVGRVNPMLINVTISSFTEVSTINLQFAANFLLTLRWRDDRISFINLNNVTNLNKVEQVDRDMMWIPNVVFRNAITPSSTTLNEDTKVLINREHEPRQGSFRRAVETDVYDGDWVSIVLQHDYHSKFECEFNLHNYPFDSQKCEMVFELTGITSKYMSFIQDGPGVNYLGKDYLTEFKVQEIKPSVVEIDDELKASTYSLFKVSVLFERRSEFHLLNIYLQTIVLNITAFLTLFFDVTNFSDRIMVALTVMLVVATIMTSIQSSLPPTAYYKLIDIWLLFTLNIIVVLMIGHTILAWRMKKEEEEMTLLLPAFNPAQNGNPKTVRPVSAISRASRFRPDRDDRDFPTTRKWNKIFKISVFSFVSVFLVIYWSISMTAWLTVETL